VVSDTELTVLVQTYEAAAPSSMSIHQKAVLTSLRELQRVRLFVRGVAGCATCEACRGAAHIVMGTT
jgi:hypothetical protein